MTNVYILGLKYMNSTPSDPTTVAQNLSDTLSRYKGSSQLEVRGGYFGMCVRQRGIVWLCSSDAAGLAEQIGSTNDALNMIGAVSQFKDDVLFSGLLFMVIVISFASIILLATFPGWQEKELAGGSEYEVRPFPPRSVLNAVIACCFASAALVLIAALWQHIGSVGAAAMAEIANYGNVKANIGNGATSMVWIAFAVLSLSALLIAGIFVWVRHMDREED